MTGTRAYDAEALKARKPPIATMFATRCSDRIRVRDRRLARLSRDVRSPIQHRHRWSARRGSKVALCLLEKMTRV